MRSLATLQMALVPLVTLGLDLGLVAILVALGEFRTDRWWLAGFSFVAASLVATVAVEARSATPSS